MGFIEVMRERQMLAQITHEDELITHLKEKPRAAYAGFDPTAESLHVGHLLPVLAWRHGHGGRSYRQDRDAADDQRGNHRRQHRWF